MNLFDIFESEGEYILYFDGKPVAKYDSVYDAEFQARLVKKKVPDLNFEIKKEVCTYQPVQLKENLRDWFKDKWVRFGPDGKIRGDCARGDSSEGKPKCLPQSKAHALGKKGRASAAARKRREDPNPERSGAAINVSTKKKSNEGVAESSNKNQEAIRRIQKMLNDKFDANLDVDGVLGPLTLKSINKFMPNAKVGLADEPNKTTAVQGKKVKNKNTDKLDEKWSQKYKKSINCSHPKGFSQRAHCAGKKKHNESIEMEMVCEDCGMCETHSDHENLDEACWKGYHKEGNKKMFGKTYPNCVKNEGVAEGLTKQAKARKEAEAVMNVITRLEAVLKDPNPHLDKADIQRRLDNEKRRLELYRDVLDEQGVAEEKCPHCSGPMFSELMINEKKDACYYKVKSRYKVWPSAYASGALVKCRKKGAANWGNKSESMNEFVLPSDDGNDGFDDQMLKRLAAQWYNGDEDPRVEKTLAAAGWEIGQDEGYDGEPGVFVVQTGDTHGNSYMSWPADELRQDIAEVFQNDEANLFYRYDPSDGRLKQRMVSNYDERQAFAQGFKHTPEQALRVHGIIRSKFNPTKWVQKQGNRWVEVFPYGQQGIKETAEYNYRNINDDDWYEFDSEGNVVRQSGPRRYKFPFGPDKTIKLPNGNIAAKGMTAKHLKLFKDLKNLPEGSTNLVTQYGDNVATDSNTPIQTGNPIDRPESMDQIIQKYNNTTSSNNFFDKYDKLKTSIEQDNVGKHLIRGARYVPGVGTALAGLDIASAASKGDVKPAITHAVNTAISKVPVVGPLYSMANQGMDMYKRLQKGDDVGAALSGLGVGATAGIPGMAPLKAGARLASQGNNAINKVDKYLSNKGRPESIEAILAQKGQTVSEDSSMNNVKEYYNVVGTNPTTLRKEFHMSKDKIGWFLKEGSTPRHKLDAIRAFGSPKLKEYNLAAFSGGTQTKGEDNVISPVGSKTRAQYKK